MSRLTRDGTAEPVSRDQILRHARGQGNIHFPCSADHEQDWQPYPVDPYSAICDDHTRQNLFDAMKRFCLRSLYPDRPGCSVGKPRNLLTLGREFESRCSHTNWDFSNKNEKKMPKWRTIKSLVHKIQIRLHADEGKE